MSNPVRHLGDVIRDEMEAQGVSENAAALGTGISRQTLHRRLVSGEFNTAELGRVARLLDLPASELMRRAEGVAA